MRPAQGLRSLPRGGGGGHKNKRPISKTGHGWRGRGVLAAGAGGGARSLRGGGGKGLGRRPATREHGHGGSASRSGLCRPLSSEITAGRQCHQDGGRGPALRRVASRRRPGPSRATLQETHRPARYPPWWKHGHGVLCAGRGASARPAHAVPPGGEAPPGATLCREQRCSAASLSNVRSPSHPDPFLDRRPCFSSSHVPFWSDK